MITNPGLAPFVDFVSKAGQSFFNWVLTNLVKAVDGVEGGNYAPLNLLSFLGAGFAGTVGGTLSLGADGRVALRVDTTTLGNSNATFRAGGAISDLYVCDANLTANVDWTIDNTGAVEGELCLVRCSSTGAGRGNILDNSSTVIAFFPANGASTGTSTVTWILLRMGPTDWEAVAGHPDCFIS